MSNDTNPDPLRQRPQDYLSALLARVNDEAIAIPETVTDSDSFLGLGPESLMLTKPRQGERQ